MNILNKRIEYILSKNLKNYYCIEGANYPLKLEFINSLIEHNKKVLYFISSESTALSFKADFTSLFNTNVDFLPESQNKFYEDVPQNPYIYFNQINALLNKSNLVLANYKVLFEKFPNKTFFDENSLYFSVGDSVDYANLRNLLSSLGYRAVTTVSDIGEFSLRGDILDIYSFDNYPYRIEFFSDMVEDIRYFDTYTQKSISHLKNIKVFPFYKFILDDKNSIIFSKLLKKNGKFELAEIFEQDKYFDGIEYYTNYFNSKLVSVLDFFDDYVIVFDDFSSVEASLVNFSSVLDNEFDISNNSPIKFQLGIKNHFVYSDILNSLSNFIQFSFDSFVSDFEKIEYKTSLLPEFSGNMEIIAKFIKQSSENSSVNICTNYKERLLELFNEFEIFNNSIHFFPQISYGGQFEINNLSYIYISDRELFNKRNKQTLFGRYTKNKLSSDFITSINDIKEGDFVVHSIHGIGKFIGLEKISIDNCEKDYLSIQFSGTDKLYMPAEQINLLNRYRGDGNTKPTLSKMGGRAWNNTKSSVKKSVDIIAGELIALYAKRKMSKGIAFDEDTPWQIEMEDAFEWVETPDQMKAIFDTKADMEADLPMDRLICADVGFGKTEVALRAIFKCVMSGYQALMLAPTTILSHQHFITLSDRFKPFSVVVEELSRFKTKKEQADIIRRFKEGKIDVVVGTHRILQKDVEPNKIGLLVIDEEHKFGVKHKEKIKTLKQNIDVLSLSATPIPRTLNMALTGIKGLSVINTPPVNRLPIKTYVGELNPEYIKNAVNSEILRSGQIFYLYNRVETIYDKFAYLKQIIPNANIAVAHGQMSVAELENIINDFILGKYDVLLSTTIIESGLDIPNVNTIIIDDADRFGLAQLYQLRGRVGRSDRQAYCYCFYKKDKVLSEDATKRLKAIKDFTSLGAGYQIALRDIEFRGVGNLFGAKQHGRMLSVGYDAYCDILNETILELKAKQEGEVYHKANAPTIVDINANAYIPDEWVGSYDQKMIEYKKLSDVSSLSELESATISFKDRFSKLPESVENLIKLIKIRLLATNLGFFKIKEVDNAIKVYVPYSAGEWNILKTKLNKNIFAKFTYKLPPRGASDYKGILVFNKNYDDFEKIFNILSDLMYDISRYINNN